MHDNTEDVINFFQLLHKNTNSELFEKLIVNRPSSNNINKGVYSISTSGRNGHCGLNGSQFIHNNKVLKHIGGSILHGIFNGRDNR